MSAGSVPIAVAKGCEAVGGAGGHEGHRPGQDRGVGLGVGAAADADQGLADDVVEGEHAGVDRVAAEDRAEGEGGAVALGGSSSSEVAISSAPRRAVISETGLAKGV